MNAWGAIVAAQVGETERGLHERQRLMPAVRGVMMHFCHCMVFMELVDRLVTCWEVFHGYGLFDPYHRWLSIPPSEQPPNHYRLLGLQQFESSVEVIENAAARQSAHVRQYLQSPLRPYAINLIREIEVARVCLLDEEAKIGYDAWLRQRLHNCATTESGKGADSHPTGDLAFDTSRNARVAT